MPDRFLQAEPLAAMMEAEKVSTGAGVPTIWNDLLRYLDEHPEKADTCYRLMVGGSAAPPAMIKAYQERHDIEIIHGWGMTEMSPVGTLAIPPAAAEKGSDEYWRYRRPRAGSSSASRAGSSARTAGSSRGTASRWVSSRSAGPGSPRPTS